MVDDTLSRVNDTCHNILLIILSHLSDFGKVSIYFDTLCDFGRICASSVEPRCKKWYITIKWEKENFCVWDLKKKKKKEIVARVPSYP